MQFEGEAGAKHPPRHFAGDIVAVIQIRHTRNPASGCVGTAYALILLQV